MTWKSFFQRVQSKSTIKKTFQPSKQTLSKSHRRINRFTTKWKLACTRRYGPRSMTIGTAAALLKCKLPRKRVKLQASMADALNCGPPVTITAGCGSFFPGWKRWPRRQRKSKLYNVHVYGAIVKVVLLNELVAGSYTSLANVSRTIPLLPMPRSSHRASSIKVSCLVALQLQRPRLGSRTTPAHVSSLSNLTLFVGADTDIHFIFGIFRRYWWTVWREYSHYVVVFIISSKIIKDRKNFLFNY